MESTGAERYCLGRRLEPLAGDEAAVIRENGRPNKADHFLLRLNACDCHDHGNCSCVVLVTRCPLGGATPNVDVSFWNCDKFWTRLCCESVFEGVWRLCNCRICGIFRLF